MKLIAFDTSTDACSCALFVNGAVEERFEIAPRQHAQKLLSMVETVLREADLELARLFGAAGASEVQTKLNLAADAFYQVVKQVGSYDEIFDRNLNPLDLFRVNTLNDLFTRGGMIYAPPAK